MKRTRLTLIGITVLLLGLLLSLAACGPASETDGDTDGDLDPGTDCSNDADCQDEGANATCNIAAAKCVVHGECTLDDQCESWYGQTRPYCVGGLCDPYPSGDGDEPDGDGSDGDQPDGDEVTCAEFSGLYDGEYACGTTENHDTWVALDYQTCSIIIYHDGQSWTGDVRDDSITIDEGATCTGSGEEFGNITLDCGSCQVTLTPKGGVEPDGDAPQGEIRIFPSEMAFGALAVGVETVRTVTIENLGTTELTIESMFLTAGTSDEFEIMDTDSTWAMPKVMSYGGRDDLSVAYMPRQEIAREGMLVIFSDAVNQPVSRIRLYSEVKASPNVDTEPGAVGFGSAPPGFSNTKYFLIKNIGSASANITDIRFVSNPGDLFDIEFNPENTPPLWVEAGYSVAVTMTFAPVDECIKSSTETCRRQGQLAIDWLDRDENEQTTYVDLLGEISELEPACIDIAQLEGTPGIWGLGDIAGPGLKFGYRQIGVPHTRELKVTNCGDLPLELYSPTWNEGYTGPPLSVRAFGEANGAFRNYTINRREQVFIPINYYPVTEGTINTAAWQFTTNAEKFTWLPGGVQDPNTAPELQGLVLVGATGIAARRGIEVLPSKLDFGLITLGCCSRPEELTVYNIGDLTLTITSIDIGAGSDDKFELLGLPASYPIGLGGEGNAQSLRFQVKFCPSHEGEHIGRVEISSDDGDDAQLIINLRGEGTTQTHQRDVFIQNSHPMVDVLWVIDYSGSMSEEQDKVKDQTNLFVTRAVQWNVDMHLAVTSVDLETSGCSGNFIGEPPVLANKGPNALDNATIISKFKDRAGSSNCGSGTEQGLEAAHLALSEPLISGRNKDFLREDAKLSIIFLSDEEDQSVADIPFFIDYYRSIKGMRNVNMIEIYAIVGDANGGCSDGQGESANTAAEGKRYIQVADACNIHDGIHFHSICASTYLPVFETMSENLFALRNQFFLSRLADESTLVVSVNGVTSTDYTYDDVSNSIIFPQDDPPEPGAEIVAEYDTLCLH
jgi:hypothetical protein